MSSDLPVVPKPRLSTPLLAALVLAATLLVYLGTLQFEFVYDDLGQIVSNPAVQNWQYFPLYFRHNVWMQQFAVGNYYRPVFLTWLLVNHSLFGLHAWLWHLSTVLAHLGATGLVFVLALRLTKDRRAAAIAALLFGLHPVHLEAVAWISGVTEPLLALLVIPAFLCYLNGRERRSGRWGWLAAALGFYGLALLAKETAVVLPGLVLAYEWLFASPEARWKARLGASARAIAPFVAVTGVYLLARAAALHGLAHKTVQLPASVTLLTMPSVLWWYVRLLVAPVQLSAFYDTPYVTQFGVRYFLIPLIGVAATAALLVRWWRRSREPLVAFASLWLFLPIVPLLNLSMLPMGDFIHDRYLYLPSVGLAILAAIALVKLDRRQLLRRPAGQAVTLALTLLMGVGTVAQSLPWASDLLLYYHGMQVAPNNDLPRNKLAASFVQRGMFDEGIKLYRVVLASDPDYWYANYRMGYAHYMTGQYAEAERYLARAVALHATPDEFYYLGLAQMKLGRNEAAREALEEAVRLQPDAAPYREALAKVRQPGTPRP